MQAWTWLGQRSSPARAHARGAQAPVRGVQGARKDCPGGAAPRMQGFDHPSLQVAPNGYVTCCLEPLATLGTFFRNCWGTVFESGYTRLGGLRNISGPFVATCWFDQVGYSFVEPVSGYKWSWNLGDLPSARPLSNKYPSYHSRNHADRNATEANGRSKES